jgi:hypothetical protein
MKKLVLLLAGGMVTAGAFAQGWGPAAGQPLTAEGTLQLQNGVIVLASGDTFYAVPGLSRYVGFIEGLKEGARVSIQGYSGGYNLIYPSRLTVNGKTYDLAANAPGGMGYGYGMTYGRGHHGGRYGGYGRGCW